MVEAFFSLRTMVILQQMLHCTKSKNAAIT